MGIISVRTVRKEVLEGELKIIEIEDVKLERGFVFVGKHGKSSRLIDIFKWFVMSECRRRILLKCDSRKLLEVAETLISIQAGFAPSFLLNRKNKTTNMCFSEYILRVGSLVACFYQPVSMLLCSKGTQIDNRVRRDYEGKGRLYRALHRGKNHKVLIMSAVHFCDTLKSLMPRAEQVKDFN